MFLQHPQSNQSPYLSSFQGFTPTHLLKHRKDTDHPLAIHIKFWYILSNPKPLNGNSVKHLLILISILLLSSPVIGDNHKGETLYLWGKYPNYVWKGFGDKDTQPKYQGQVKDGKPNGLGVIIYTNGSKYVGGWENGK